MLLYFGRIKIVCTQLYFIAEEQPKFISKLILSSYKTYGHIDKCSATKSLTKLKG